MGENGREPVLNEGTSDKKSGFIALVGIPNAGKSTLINQLVGAKVSIVTHKVQTTRHCIRGIVQYDNAQLVFVDMPGIFQPKRRLDRAMVRSAWAGAHDADIVLFLIDAHIGLQGDNKEIIEKLKHISAPKILVLNKIDSIKKEKLLELTKEVQALYNFEKVFMVSALTGAGCQDILKYLSKVAPVGPWYYPEDQISDMPLRQLASEITREKLYLRLHEELPYISTVETSHWENHKDGSVKITQTIFVEQESQKKIVIGRNGETIKAIGKKARQELIEMLECNVHLFLFVKVRNKWGDDPERYHNIGLEFTK